MYSWHAFSMLPTHCLGALLAPVFTSVSGITPFMSFWLTTVNSVPPEPFS
jgi:hypothetical protein